MQVAIFQFLANTATSRKVIHLVIRWKDIRFIMVVTVARKINRLAITIFSPKSLIKNNRNITTYLMVKNGYVLSVPLLNIAVKRNFSSRNPVNKLGTLAPQQNSVNVRSCCSCNQRFDWLDNQPRKQPGTSIPDKRFY